MVIPPLPPEASDRFVRAIKDFDTHNTLPSDKLHQLVEDLLGTRDPKEIKRYILMMHPDKGGCHGEWIGVLQACKHALTDEANPDIIKRFFDQSGKKMNESVFSHVLKDMKRMEAMARIEEQRKLLHSLHPPPEPVIEDMIVSSTPSDCHGSPPAVPLRGFECYFCHTTYHNLENIFTYAPKQITIYTHAIICPTCCNKGCSFDMFSSKRSGKTFTGMMYNSNHNCNIDKTTGYGLRKRTEPAPTKKRSTKRTRD